MKDKNKVEEPYSPANTPEPPQIKDPSNKTERNEPDPPQDVDKKNRKGPSNEESGKEEAKLLGESETEIDDETTI